MGRGEESRMRLYYRPKGSVHIKLIYPSELGVIDRFISIWMYYINIERNMIFMRLPREG